MSIIQNHIQTVLTETVRTLFPFYANPTSLVKQHVWRNKKYVGEANGRIAVWVGHSVNLAAIDFRYRAVFVDYVANVLPHSERVRLYGDDFANSIRGLEDFVVMFVLDFPRSAVPAIESQGFTVRIMGTGRSVHACIIATANEFTELSSLHWVSQIVRLVLLQRFLSTHRKPFAENEVPLQHLLYQTGYLHSYIVNSGLHLYELSKPRRAGGFGHDFHAVVYNPRFSAAPAFPLGFEVYVGPLGYHLDTIPQYVERFDLRGIVVVAKDNPISELRFDGKFNLPVFEAESIKEIGNPESVGIHYLPLEKVVIDLAMMRDKLEMLLPVTRFIEGDNS